MNKEKLLEDIEDILEKIDLEDVEDGVLIYCENQEFFERV